MTYINNIINEIENDITSRDGIGNEWEMIDDDIKKEIKENWKKLIMKHNYIRITELENMLYEIDTVAKDSRTIISFGGNMFKLLKKIRTLINQEE